MLKKKQYIIPVFVYCFILFQSSIAQSSDTTQYWHGIERSMHYQPQGNDFLLVNGHRKFNRALYGTNTAFRVETGDLPEFALYMPGMGGNCKIGFIINNKSKWLTECDSIKTIYHQAAMLYEVKDKVLGNGIILITVLATSGSEGMIMKIQSKNFDNSIELLIAYGGASGKKFSRDGDIGADPESSFYLQPEYCKDNIFKINKNGNIVLIGNLAEWQVLPNL